MASEYSKSRLKGNIQKTEREDTWPSSETFAVGIKNEPTREEWVLYNKEFIWACSEQIKVKCSPILKKI